MQTGAAATHRGNKCGNGFGTGLTREKRVVLMILILGALNVFDLWIAVFVYNAGALHEANPVARYVIDNHGVVGISIYKLALVGMAFYAFWLGRRSLLTEVGCLTSTLVYLAVACLWTCYPVRVLVCG